MKTLTPSPLRNPLSPLGLAEPTKPAKAGEQRPEANHPVARPRGESAARPTRHTEMAVEAIERAFFLDTVDHLKKGGKTIRERMKEPMNMEVLKLSLLERGRVLELEEGAKPLAVRRIDRLQLPTNISFGALRANQVEKLVQDMANKSRAKIETTFFLYNCKARLTPNQHELKAKYFFVLDSIADQSFSFAQKAAEEDPYVRDIQRTAREVGLRLVLLPNQHQPVAILPSLDSVAEQLWARSHRRVRAANLPELLDD